MQELDGILKFIKLTHDFQKVERALKVKDENRHENDVEHSYQIAMVGWYIICAHKLPLDINKVIQYALLHDLVEVYAGDTYVFDPDPQVHATKALREHEALTRLIAEFSEFPEMTDIITKYESRLDEESKFVYALDKIIPPMNIYLDNGRTWRERNQTLDGIIMHGKQKVGEHSSIEKYFNQLMERLQQERSALFNDNE